jgi:ABC-type methionine transport system permease subunit
MSQKITHSMYETIINVGSGAIISFVLNIVLLPHMIDGLEHSLIQTSIIISIVFTVISMLRSFVFRRFFNRF